MTVMTAMTPMKAMTAMTVMTAMTAITAMTAMTAMTALFTGTSHAPLTLGDTSCSSQWRRCGSTWAAGRARRGWAARSPAPSRRPPPRCLRWRCTQNASPCQVWGPLLMSPLYTRTDKIPARNRP